MPPSENPIAYSVADACRVSSLGRTKLFALIRDKKLKVTRIGRRTLVQAQSLRQLVEAGE